MDCAKDEVWRNGVSMEDTSKREKLKRITYCDNAE